MIISQVATSLMCNFPSDNFPKVRLGLLGRRMLQWGPSAVARKDLGNCTVVKFPIGKIHLGSCRLGKKPLGEYLTFIYLLFHRFTNLLSFRYPLSDVLVVQLNMTINNQVLDPLCSLIILNIF